MTTVRRVGDVQMVGAMYHIPAGSDPDFAAAQLLTYILTDQPSGRLYKSLIETKKATSMYGHAFALHDPVPFCSWRNCQKTRASMMLKRR